MTAPSRSRWVVCALLFGATLLNYLDRQTLSVLAPLIREEMHLNNEDLGKLFAWFLGAYTVGQILAGFIIDRVDVRIAYAVAVALWSLTGAATGLTTGFVGLLILRTALGVSEGANWPSALRVVSRVFPPAERALANGIFQSGVSVGAVIAPLLLVSLAHSFGWRSGFIAIGLAGLVWVGLWLFLMPGTQPAAVTASSATDATVPRTSTWQLFQLPKMWGLILGGASINPYLYFLVNWLPTYFVNSSGLPFGAELAKRLFVVYLALGVGYLSGGALATYLARRMDFGLARRRVIGAGAALMVLIPLVAWVANIDAITGIICLSTLGLGWFTSNLNAFATEVSHDRVSTVSGILGSAGSIAGLVFMLLVGFITHKTGNFTLPFLMCGLMPVTGWIGVLVLTRQRLQRIPGP